MQTISYTNARNNLKDIMQQVNDDSEPLTIVRADAQAVVMMGANEYNALHETLHLLSSPTNAKKLFKSITKGKFSEYKNTEDLFNDL